MSIDVGFISEQSGRYPEAAKKLMKRDRERRPHWSRRALVLVLVGGFVGWVVAYVGLIVLLMAFSISGPVSSFDQVVAEFGGDLALGGLACGVPCGAALGLVVWAAWVHRGEPQGSPRSGRSALASISTARVSTNTN